MTLSKQQRRALGIIAGARNGVTMALMRMNGFVPKTLADLVVAGLATVEIETVRAGGQLIEVKRFRITDMGRQALIE